MSAPAPEMTWLRSELLAIRSCTVVHDTTLAPNGASLDGDQDLRPAPAPNGARTDVEMVPEYGSKSAKEQRTAASWLAQAACRGRPTSWWFPKRGDAFSAAVAKAVCAGCAVRTECLTDALEHEPEATWGIRGGLSAEQRERLGRRGRTA